MKMIFSKVWIRFAIFALAGFLYGCLNLMSAPTPTSIYTPSIDQMDKSPFTGVPCAIPCWQGLEVGKSSESDVQAVLPNLTFIHQETIQSFHVSMPSIDASKWASGVLIEASCVNSSQTCLSLSVIDNILTRIIVGINYEIRPQEAIEYLGNPDYVGYDNLGAETVMCEVYLVWHDSRFVLATRFEDSIGAENYCNVIHNEGKVPASLLLSEARYLSDPELNAKLNTGTGKFFEYSGVLPEK